MKWFYAAWDVSKNRHVRDMPRECFKKILSRVLNRWIPRRQESKKNSQIKMQLNAIIASFEDRKDIVQNENLKTNYFVTRNIFTIVLCKNLMLASRWVAVTLINDSVVKCETDVDCKRLPEKKKLKMTFQSSFTTVGGSMSLIVKILIVYFWSMQKFLSSIHFTGCNMLSWLVT